MAEPEAIRSPQEVRLACRRNALKTVASRALSGYLCVNVVMMDEAFAAEFEGFCRANPKPCPLLAVMPAGRTDCPEFARGLDIRTDLGSYDVIREGVVVEQRRDVVSLYSGDMVTFLIGSSVSFDGLLVEKGYEPAFGPCIQLTDLDCEPAGRFRSKMAVTMRSFLPDRCDAVWEYTSHFPACHGAPLGRDNGRRTGYSGPECDDFRESDRGSAGHRPPLLGLRRDAQPGGTTGPAAIRPFLHARPRDDHGYSNRESV